MPASHNVPLKDIVDLVLRGEDRRPVLRGGKSAARARLADMEGGAAAAAQGADARPDRAPKAAKVLVFPSAHERGGPGEGAALRESMPLDRDETLSAADGSRFMRNRDYRRRLRQNGPHETIRV
jgi:hypothetical protein